mgnify:CR=1 FL=1
MQVDLIDVRTPMDLQHRKGIALGDGTAAVLEKIGRPDAMTEAEPKLRNLGDTEYFYICRVEQDCARHTSVFTRDGVVTAIAGQSDIPAVDAAIMTNPPARIGGRPTRSTIQLAMTFALPLSSISLPKIAPSRNTGKYWTRYPPKAGMNICV